MGARHEVDGCWGSLLVECRTHCWKVASSNPCRSGGIILFSGVNFVCWLLFGVCSTPVLPQWHIREPSHSAKSAGGRLHLNSYTPLTQQSRSGLTMPLCRQCGNLSVSGNKLIRNSSGNTQTQSSQFTKPLWTDPGLKRRISVHNLISIFFKSAGREWMVKHSPKILAHTEKARHTHRWQFSFACLACCQALCRSYFCLSSSSSFVFSQPFWNMIIIWSLLFSHDMSSHSWLGIRALN